VGLTPTTATQNQTFNSPASSLDDLARVFNTALISTRADSSTDVVKELYSTMATPAFQAILNSVRVHAKATGLSDREAADAIVQTFRKIDRLWSDYLTLEGADRLKNAL